MTNIFGCVIKGVSKILGAALFHVGKSIKTAAKIRDKRRTKADGSKALCGTIYRKRLWQYFEIWYVFYDKIQRNMTLTRCHARNFA